MKPTRPRLIQNLARQRFLLLATTFATITALDPIAPAAGLSRGGFSASGGTSAPGGISGSQIGGSMPQGAYTPGQAQAQTAQSMADLQAAARFILAQQGIQAAAHTTAASGPNSLGAGLPAVTDGLSAGGLIVASQVGSDPSLWQNANAPTQSTSNGQTTVTVQQTAQKAILTWSQFNVGRNTTLYFDQSGGAATDGNNNWIVLNRVIDPSGVPSQILGSIKAEGSVYLINANGVIFGGSSQVNTHSLLVSSLPFLTDTPNYNTFTPGSVQYDAAVQAGNTAFTNSDNGGIAAPEASDGTPGTNPNVVVGLGTSTTSYTPTGAITLQPGASITTHVNGSENDGGFVLIAAPNVTNSGSIVAADGQIILAAGVGVSLYTARNSSSPWLTPMLTGIVTSGGVDQTPAGTLINNGLLQADRGNVTLLGSTTTINGVVAVSTSVSRPGSIVISTVDEGDDKNDLSTTPADRRAGPFTMGNGAVISNLPDEDGQTVPSDTSSFTPGTVTVTAGSITLQNGSLLEAPGATVQLAAFAPSTSSPSVPPNDPAVQGRIYIDNGATIDVAGIADVQLSMSDTLVTIPLIGLNELADSALQRDGALFGLKDVVIDSTLSGVTADGLAWVGSPILNASGYTALVPRTIDQLLTNGGTITLSGGQVMTAAGSSLNLDGGYVHYLGGNVATTRLVDIYGQMVNIGDADPNDTYVGIAGQFVVNHPHWGITETYNSPLLQTSPTYEADYIVGGNAGTLNVFGDVATVLDGNMTAQAFAGLKQVGAGLAPSGTAAGGNFVPTGGTFSLGDPKTSSAAFTPNMDSLTGEIGSIVVQDTAPQLANLSPGFSANTALDTAALNALGTTDPDNILANTVIPAATLTSGGFANVTAVEDKNLGRGLVVAEGTTLEVQPGGKISLTGGGAAIDILGSLIAPSGTISITSTGSGLSGGTSEPIEVGSHAVISVAGEWVNDSAPGTNTAGDATYINGGTISLTTGSTSQGGFGGTLAIDATPSIVLDAGSVLDLSSGGAILPSGQMLLKNGVAEGNGGSLSLITYSGQLAVSQTEAQPVTAQIVMDGTIRSEGFSGGGTLTLQGTGFQIGGDPTATPNGYLYLPTSFFADQGFGSYVLNAMYETTVAPGAFVPVTQQNLIPDLPALALAPTGSDLNAGGLTTIGTLDPFHRQPTNLAMTGGAYLLWTSTNNVGSVSPPPVYPGVTGAVTVGEGATILGDAGAKIGLGSPMQVTVLGSIIAPGGSIALSADTGSNPDGSFQPGQASFGQGWSSSSKSVWLGPDALLDVSGVALVDPLATPVRNGLGIETPVTGKVLAGGSVIVADDSGYVVAEAGSRIEASGAAATFDMPVFQSGLGGIAYAPQEVWSNAGTITLGASSGLLFDGTLRAEAGAPQAEGGTLVILPESAGQTFTQGFVGVPVANSGATAIVLEQSGDFVPAGLAPGQALSSTAAPSNGILYFAVDRLKDSGITTLQLENPLTTVGSTQKLVPVGFLGNVDLSLDRALIINAPELAILNATQMGDITNPDARNSFSLPDSLSTVLSQGGTTSVGGASVTLSAPYIAIAGAPLPQTQTPVLPVTSGDGSLHVNAGSFLDVENQVGLADFGDTYLTSGGAIRFSTVSLLETSNTQPGFLYTPGNLTLTAAQVYPSTNSTFILDAVGPNPTTITIASNGAPAPVPLSAGGSLLLDATTIVQGGVLQAPAGTLVLGVNNPTDAATQTQFDNLPLVQTDTVTLAGGSTTSVSLDGAIVPYGATVDGKEWQYNAVQDNNQVTDLTAPPSKTILLNGTNIALNGGATVDLSGGGDLQAEEWVPGTGGTRNVLSQYSIVTAANGTQTAVPFYPDARNIYAVIPGYQSPVAAYDPYFALSSQYTSTKVVQSLGVGQAGAGNLVGQAVYLSGVPGLAPGVYTLLPALYATLPGAFRVVQNTGATSVVPGLSATMPDGTAVVSGYMVDTLTGARGAAPLQFDVQSGPVWQQYSQYNLTSANSFFAAQAAAAGNAVPALPNDAGRLALAATGSLSLDTTLKASAAAGGAGAEVDIASQDIQIVGQGETGLNGYLQISANSLNDLGAASLLIGGTRTQTADGVTIDALANSVVVSNDADHPLTGPEILLVTKTDTTGTDANAANGLRIDSGSDIEAKGSISAASEQAITIGSSTVSGDGALVRVSNGGDVALTRDNLPATGAALGLLDIAAGATIQGGASLTLDSSGDTRIAPGAVLSGTHISADSSLITFVTGDTSSVTTGMVIGATTLSQFADAQQISLRSYGAIDFEGDITVTVPNDLVLSAGSFTTGAAGTPGNVTIQAGTLGITNDLNGAAPTTPVVGTGSLNLIANEIDFGTAGSTLASTTGFSGFGSVAVTATGGIVAEGNGTIDFGALPVTMTAPVIAAGTGAGETIKTSGALALNQSSGTAPASANGLGGAIILIGGTVNDAALITARSGNVTLEATGGDLTVASNAVIDVSGTAQPFFDVTEYSPGGNIGLTSDTGTVHVASGAVLNFSGASDANGGSNAGAITLTAPVQTVDLQGTLLGGGGSGALGGSFTLDVGAGVNLDALASELTASGIDNLVSIHTRSGNLVLSAGNTIKAADVVLIADGGTGGYGDTTDGNVEINGTIDASGAAGGAIDLFGKSNVDVEGTLLAVGTAADQRGGTIQIGTTAVFDPATGYNGTYGYENVDPAASGAITLGTNAKIDVSGGMAGGLGGGTISLRAPFLSTGDVNVTIDAAPSHIIGARSVTLEAYATWSTTDATGGAGQPTAAQHFDGIIDPAGWYNSAGTLLSGAFTDASGNTVATWNGTTLANPDGTPATHDLSYYLSNDFFAPTNPNTDHETFYGFVGGDATTGTPGTLMGFIQSGLSTTFGSRFAGIANFQAAPGVELDNPSATINGGDISVLTNWNLGAGTTNASGTYIPVFRYLNTIAPILTLRAENNFQVDASITDGFYTADTALPTDPAGTLGYNSEEAAYVAEIAKSDVPNSTTQIQWESDASPLPTASFSSVDPNYLLSPPLAGQTAAYYVNYQAYLTTYDNWVIQFIDGYLSQNLSEPSFLATPPNPANYGVYGNYVSAYLTWVHNAFSDAPDPSTSSNYAGYLSAFATWISSNFSDPSFVDNHTAPAPAPPTDPTQYTAYTTSMVNDYYNFLYNNAFNSAFTATTYEFAPIFPESIPAAASTGPAPILAANLPGNVPSAAYPLPLQFASLIGGQSASYRIVAGANSSSADPLAVQASSALGGGGNVTVDGHFTWTNPADSQPISAPTAIRTGTGSIDIAAGGSLTLADATAPGVIYAGGAPAAGAPVGTTAALILNTSTFSDFPDIPVSPVVSPDSGGSVTIAVQGDIHGVETVVNSAGTSSGLTNLSSDGNFWWQWLEVGPAQTVIPATSAAGSTSTETPMTQTSIDFAAFDQGVMSVGGNVSIKAGGTISDLGASVPTTWYLNNGTVNTVGGGDLTVSAGKDILSGTYFVAKGTGTITAGGRIASDLTQEFGFGNTLTTTVSTLLAAQDGILNVSARQGVDIGAVVDPSYEILDPLSSYHQYSDSQGYSARSALNVFTTTGDVRFGTLQDLSLIGTTPSSTWGTGSEILPASLNLTAFSGGIDVATGGYLFPSATGQLNLIAAQSIVLSNAVPAPFSTLTMLDVDPAAMPSPQNPVVMDNDNQAEFAQQQSILAHSLTPLHADDREPIRIYSVNGNIVDGVFNAPNFANLYGDEIGIVVDKPALIQAGGDIVNLSFTGQNLRDDDVTRVVAGHDIYDTPFAQQFEGGVDNTVAPSLILGGPGTLDVEAGRNIGPLTNQLQSPGNTLGIEAIGNHDNPNLPRTSANVQVLYGVGPGIDDADFLAQYVAPGAAIPGVDTTPALIAFMENYDEGKGIDTGLVKDRPVVTLTAAQAWTEFQALPAATQQVFVEQALFVVLTQVGADYNEASSPFFHQYARGYQAINTLFPASYGYTDNSLAGGANTGNVPVSTGDLDMRSTTIQTQQGGNVTILGPGGEALVGSTDAPPSGMNPSMVGILTLEQGNIQIMTDQSVLLAQSRIFTEQGGGITIWSSNGDINAGKGAKTIADVPPPVYVSDDDGYNIVDARGEVTGAGIATLQTIPGAATGNVFLLAPTGTVDAGDAGIRVSGDLVVAALQVLNADNIVVQGNSSGVPTAASVDIGGLSSANNAAAAIDAAMVLPTHGSGDINVEVIGFGGGSATY